MIIIKRSIAAIHSVVPIKYDAILITGSKCEPCHALLERIQASPEEDQSVLLRRMAVIEYDDPNYQPDNKQFAMASNARTIPALVMNNGVVIPLADKGITDAKALTAVIEAGC